MNFTRLAAAVLTLSLPFSASPTRAAGGDASDGNCMTAEQRVEVEREVAAFKSAHPELAEAATKAGAEAGIIAGAGAAPKLITVPKIQFYPLAGILTKDIYRARFVDVDQFFSFSDFECGTMTYDGHSGIDGELGGFGHQAIGVPVFAALNGTVSAVHDGEDDQSVTTTSKPANFIAIDHGSGIQSAYYHLKKNSILVTAGDVVKAGQQIALMGSSGQSATPQLHFEMSSGSIAYEPSFGECGDKVGWENQVPIRHDLYIRDFGFAAGTLSAAQKFPNEIPATGSIVRGAPSFTIWFRLHNAPPATTLSIKLIRPNATTIATLNSSLGNANLITSVNVYVPVALALSDVGTNQCEVSINGAVKLTAPFLVVNGSGDIVNHPPNAISAHFDPAVPATDRALMCVVDNDFLLDDPDYEIVRFRYRWKVNGDIKREVVSAGLSDQFPRDSTAPGDTIRCEVYPLDALSTGTLAFVEAGIGGTATPTPSLTPTASATPSLTPTASLTPSSTPTASLTPTASPSATETESPTASQTPSFTPSETPSSTPSATASATSSPSATASPSASPTPATSAGVLDYLLGRTGTGPGLDANADGEVDIADLLKSFGP